jgi:hypothetical protein
MAMVTEIRVVSIKKFKAIQIFAPFFGCFGAQSPRDLHRHPASPHLNIAAD